MMMCMVMIYRYMHARDGNKVVISKALLMRGLAAQLRD